jgi:hypothetical protein
MTGNSTGTTHNCINAELELESVYAAGALHLPLLCAQTHGHVACPTELTHTRALVSCSVLAFLCAAGSNGPTCCSFLWC